MGSIATDLYASTAEGDGLHHRYCMACTIVRRMPRENDNDSFFDWAHVDLKRDRCSIYIFDRLLLLFIFN